MYYYDKGKEEKERKQPKRVTAYDLVLVLAFPSCPSILTRDLQAKKQSVTFHHFSPRVQAQLVCCVLYCAAVAALLKFAAILLFFTFT